MPNAFSAQSSISNSIGRAYAGMIADSSPWHVGHGVNTSVQTATVTPTAANAATYTLTITSGGTTVAYTYTSDADATVAEITAGLTAAVNAGSQPVTAVDGTTKLTLTADYPTNEYGFTAIGSSSAGTNVVANTVAQNAPLKDGFYCLFDSATSSDPMAIKLPTAAADVTSVNLCAGVVLADPYTRVRLSNASLAPSMISFMRKGHVVVQCEEAVTANSNVFVRYAAGGLGQGAFGASVGSTERAQLNGAVYRSASFALPDGSLGAVVEINIVGG